jgi:endo-1,4-beta-mannosidase
MLTDPSSQTSAMSWGQTWIKNHRDAQATYNKPVLMEEFGVLASQDQIGTYENWYTTVVDSGVTGVLIWQAGSNLTSGPTPDDGYAVRRRARFGWRVSWNLTRGCGSWIDLPWHGCL